MKPRLSFFRDDGTWKSRTTIPRLRLALGIFFILGLIFISYYPLLPGNFIWDDHLLVKDDNPLVKGDHNLFSIWFSGDFPLSTVAFWLQWLAWGEQPIWYHVTNILLHAISVGLLWRLLSRLKIPGAWLAAAIFALHPVCVNSVARIAELKNTLSLPFFLLSFLFYLRYESLTLYPDEQLPVTPQRRRYWGTWFYTFSFVAFVLALFSKTSTVALPMLLLICVAWQRGRITRKDILHTGPFFILSLAFGLMAIWFQKHEALLGLTLQHHSFLERLVIAGRNVWFYLGKALLPHDLSVAYLSWRVDAHAFMSYLPALSLCISFGACWKFRSGWGKHVLFGLGCFLVALFPVLGFFDSQFLVWFQVSDHLQYLPLIAPLALAVAILASTLPAKVFRVVGVVLLLGLSVFTFHRAQVFSNEESLWRDTLAKNPGAWIVQENLGVLLAKRANYPEAIEHFEASLHANPENPDAHANLGQALSLEGKFTEAEPHYVAAIRIMPFNPEAHKSFAQALRREGRDCEALPHLKAALRFKPEFETRASLASLLYQTGYFRESVTQLRTIVLEKPEASEMLNNLAWQLATCPDATVRNGAEAVQYAEKACRLTEFKKAPMLGTLAAAYAEAGRFPEAITNCQQTVTLASAAGETRLTDISNQLLRLYSAGKPYHELPRRPCSD